MDNCGDAVWFFMGSPSFSAVRFCCDNKFKEVENIRLKACRGTSGRHDVVVYTLVRFSSNLLSGMVFATAYL